MTHGFMVSLLLKGSSYGAVFLGGINPSPERATLLHRAISIPDIKHNAEGPSASPEGATATRGRRCEPLPKKMCRKAQALKGRPYFIGRFQSPLSNITQKGRLQALKGRQQHEAGGVNPCRKKMCRKAQALKGRQYFIGRFQSPPHKKRSRPTAAPFPHKV